MSEFSPLMLRLLSACACAANRSGGIIRQILNSGDLGLVQKAAENVLFNLYVCLIFHVLLYVRVHVHVCYVGV